MGQTKLYSLLQKIHSFALLVVVCTLPFNFPDINFNGIAIGALSLTSIALVVHNKQNLKFRSDKILLLFLLFFVTIAVGILYSSNQHEANFDLEKKLSLFIFPVILFFSPPLSIKQIQMVLTGFVFSCLAFCIAALFISFLNYRSNGSADSFYYHELSKNIGMHAGYLAMYLCFALAIILFEFPSIIRKGVSFWQILFVSLCGVFVLLLSSRLQIGIMLLIFLSFIIYHFGLYKNWTKAVLYIGLICVLFFAIVIAFPKNRERFKEAINYNNEYALNKKWGEGQMRVLIWSSSFQIIKENLLFGVGTGDVQDRLDETYKKNDYVSLTYWENTRFNAHNQFLEIAIGSGLIGLALFLTLIFNITQAALKNKNMLLLSFLAVFILSALTESVLERQNGVVFFSFFSSFLIFKYRSSKE